MSDYEMQMLRTRQFYEREMQAIRFRHVGILAPTPVADRTIIFAGIRFSEAIDGSRQLTDGQPFRMGEV
jgi:hypothetical protein